MRVSFKGKCRGDGKTYILVHALVSEGHSIEASSLNGEGESLPCKLLPLHYVCEKGHQDLVLVIYTSKRQQRVTFNEIDVRGNVVSSVTRTINPFLSKWSSRFNGVFRKHICAKIRNFDWKGLGRQSILTFDQYVESRDAVLLRGSLFTACQSERDAFIKIYDENGKQLACETTILSNTAASIDDGFDSELRELRFSVALPRPRKRFGNYCFLAGNTLNRASDCFEALETYYLEKLREGYKEAFCDAFFDPNYGSWIRRRSITGSRAELQRRTRFTYEPLFSIVVPLYKTPPVFFQEMIESVLIQTYSKWELILVNASPEDEVLARLVDQYVKFDSRINVVTISENRGITENTNVGIRVCKGDFLSFFDHDDVLEPNVLFEYATALEHHEDIDLLYCDEDKLFPDGSYGMPMFKPDFSIDLLRDNNYICHMLTVRKSLHEQLEPAGKVLDGAQDHSLALQIAEKGRRIHHVARVLYHWRISETSTAANASSKPYATQAGIRAVQQHLNRLGIEAVVDCAHGRDFRYKVDYAFEKGKLVSLIIPTQGGEAVDDLLRSLGTSSLYDPLEIIFVTEDRNSADVDKRIEETRKVIGETVQCVTAVSYSGTFNYSRAINTGANKASGDYFLFLHDDIRFDDPDMIQTLLSHCARTDVGAVGSMVCDFDGTIQQAGLIYLNGEMVPLAGGLYKEHPGYAYRPLSTQNFSAVSGVCMMTKRSTFFSIGGLNEAFGRVYGDIDYCFRLREAGLLVVYTPETVVSHRASMTRGRATDLSAMSEYYGEKALFLDRWADSFAEGDPYFNVNFSRVPIEASRFKLDSQKNIEL